MNGLPELAKRFLALRAEKFKRQGELRAIEENLDELELEMITVLEEQKGSKFDYDGNLLYEVVHSYPRILPNQEFALFDWLDSHNEGGIAKRTIHFKTLRKWYRMNINGDPGTATLYAPDGTALHPEWEEELSNFLEVYEEKNINVRGEDQDVQRAIAEEAYRKKLNGE